jgi:uncharacterized SAM-binding protein YcdF (DUF218 family)
LALLALAGLLLILTPLGDVLVGRFNVSTDDPPEADAIICLGGGSEREMRAAVLWHRQIAPIVIVSNKPGFAEAMQTRVEEAGVPAGDILVDNTSSATFDHPRNIARLPGVDPENQSFVLVTDYMHSRRARDCFLKAGYRQISVWSGYRRTTGGTYFDRCEWRIRLLPTVAYEVAAMVKYHWQGKL